MDCRKQARNCGLREEVSFIGSFTLHTEEQRFERISRRASHSRQEKFPALAMLLEKFVVVEWLLKGQAPQQRDSTRRGVLARPDLETEHGETEETLSTFGTMLLEQICPTAA